MSNKFKIEIIAEILDKRFTTQDLQVMISSMLVRSHAEDWMNVSATNVSVISDYKNPDNNETKKLVDFKNTFNALTGPSGLDVNHIELITKLTSVYGYSESDALDMIKKAMQNGQIYERREGFYAKA